MFQIKNIFLGTIVFSMVLFQCGPVFDAPAAYAATNIGIDVTADGDVKAGDGSLVLLGVKADPEPVGVNGAIYYNTTNNKFRCYENGAWKNCITLLGSASLSSVVAAVVGNIINNGDNAQRWNWQLTTADNAGFTFGENAASIAGGEPVILKVTTMNDSTALPLLVENLGNGNSFRVNDSANDSTPFLIDKDGNVAIGSNSFDPVNPERLKVDSGSTPSFNIITATGNLNDYLQINIQNRNSGDNASSDIVATADNGNENVNYIDMGINSSGYNVSSYSIGGPNDGYLYVEGVDALTDGGNLLIGTGTSGKVIKFHTGGHTAADERMRIDGSGRVGIATDSPGSELDVNGEIRFSNAAADYVGFTAPAVITASITYTLPAADGTSGQILSTNGSGVLSWGDQTTSWQRDVPTTTISPTVAGDDVTTSGDIYTTGTGGITSAGLLVANDGITANAGDLSLNAIGAFNTNISTGGATGSVNIGNPLAAAIAMVSGGSLTLTGGAASTWSTTTGDITLQPGGSGTTGLVKIRDGGADSATPDLLALDVKSAASGAGDPGSGVNGAMYYNDSSNKFRCYVNGSWSDCDTTGGTTSLQSAYNNGATITTAGGTDLALTLTSGNFTASGAGAVNLTPMGASSFTSGGALTLTGGTDSTWSTSSGALTITSAAAATWGTATGNLTLDAAGSGTTASVKIGTGGAGSTTPDLFGVDVKSTTGDPAGGYDGAMYYNKFDNLFRCYEAGGWKNCGSSAASATTLQQAYTAGPTITTSGATDLALILTSGDFTATGADSVLLTPTGASSFTSGGALTLTGGAASTWSTTAGALTIDAGTTTPDALNLGTISANAITIGQSGLTTTNIGPLQTGDATTIGSFKIADGLGNYITLTSPSLIASYTLTLPVDDGTPNQHLTTDGNGVLSWTTLPNPLTTEGDLIYYNSGASARLPIGAAGTFLKSVGGYPAWTAVTKTDVGLSNVTNDVQLKQAIGTARGQLITFTASDTPTVLPPGSNGQFLTANSAQATGLEWVDTSIAANSLNFTEFNDSMTVDENTSIDLNTKSLIIKEGASNLLALSANSLILGATTADTTTINSKISIPSGNINDGGTSNTVVGRVTSAGGNTTVVVNNSLVTTSSHVFIMPESSRNVGNADDEWFYVTPANGSFTITGEIAFADGIVFSWLVIN